MGSVIIVATFVFLIWLIINVSKNRTRKSLEMAEAEIRELSGRIMMVTSCDVPGMEIKHVLGHVTGSSKIEANTAGELDAAQLEAKAAIMRNALSMGANAIIDARLSSSAYERQGSQWMVSRSTYSGTAVII